jgi:hypothetical protein
VGADAATLHGEGCWKCGREFFYKRSATAVEELWSDDKESFTPDEINVLAGKAATLRTDWSKTAHRNYLMWYCPFCGAKPGDFFLNGADPMVIVDGRLVPDIRKERLWDTVRRLLRPEPQGDSESHQPEPAASTEDSQADRSVSSEVDTLPVWLDTIGLPVEN